MSSACASKPSSKIKVAHSASSAAICSLRVAMRAVAIARGKLNTEPHVFVAIAALCLDMGMTPYEAGVFGMLPLFHDALANAVEGAEQKPSVLRTLPYNHVKYVGPAPRMSERARGPDGER